MSAFDDEFGLFGEGTEDEERRPSALGARKIASNETIIDDIEPEDPRPPRRGGSRGPAPEGRRAPFARYDRAARPPRDPLSPEISRARGTELLTFLAKKLVSKPEVVSIECHEGARGPVLELTVDADDLGKVIGRGGRVAQALRTLVRAGAEGKISVDILDVDGEDDTDHGAPEDTESHE